MIKSESVDNYFNEISHSLNKQKINNNDYNRVNSNTHLKPD